MVGFHQRDLISFSALKNQFVAEANGFFAGLEGRVNKDTFEGMYEVYKSAFDIQDGDEDWGELDEEEESDTQPDFSFQTDVKEKGFKCFDYTSHSDHIQEAFRKTKLYEELNQIATFADNSGILKSGIIHERACAALFEFELSRVKTSGASL